MALAGSGANPSSEAAAATAGTTTADGLTIGGGVAPSAMNTSIVAQGGGKGTLPDKSRRREKV